ncbi:MAG: zinc ribbon domain-containing protein [Clostridiaceae bacterium]|nr:zinc ribbon domain-containing protein [Clostridiaceae bacterium]
MPFYDLQCEMCGKEFNIMAKISEREQKRIKCPYCGSNELRAVFKNLNYMVSRKQDRPVCPNSKSCGARCSFRE